MTVTLAFDSFKGSLRSDEVADAFAQGLCSVLPGLYIKKVYIADGGEGTAEALIRNLNGEFVNAQVCDPLGRRITARYGIVEKDRTAVIEMAAASGLTLLSAKERNPLSTHTFGTGQLIADALGKGCRNFFIGIGGSNAATCIKATIARHLKRRHFRIVTDDANSACNHYSIRKPWNCRRIPVFRIMPIAK